LLQEKFFLEGFSTIKFRYLGDDMVLLFELDGANLGKLLKGYEEWLSIMFVMIEDWKENLYSGNRLIWLRCLRIPFNVWNDDFFAQLVVLFGTLVGTDVNTWLMTNLEYS